MLYTPLSSTPYYVLAGLVVLLALILSFLVVDFRYSRRSALYEDGRVRCHCLDIVLHCYRYGRDGFGSTESSARWYIYDRHWICVTDANR
jgi:hypothetical protein